MKKLVASSLAALALTGAIAQAQTITPLSTTASTQAEAIAGLVGTQIGVATVIAAVLVGGVIVLTLSDGTTTTTTLTAG